MSFTLNPLTGKFDYFDASPTSGLVTPYSVPRVSLTPGVLEQTTLLIDQVNRRIYFDEATPVDTSIVADTGKKVVLGGNNQFAAVFTVEEPNSGAVLWTATSTATTGAVGGGAFVRANSDCTMGFGYQTLLSAIWDVDILGAPSGVGAGYDLSINNKNTSATLRLQGGLGVKIGVGIGELVPDCSYFSFTTQHQLTQISSASLIGHTIRGAASQSAHLQDWQNSSSTVLSFIDSDGGIAARSDANLGTTDFDVLKFGNDSFFYSSGLPFRFLWSNFDSGNGRLEFDDGAGILQTFRANISSETVTADSYLYAPNVYVTSLATGRIPFSNGGSLSSSSNLFWSIANNRLGIGTSSPSYDFSFGGEAARTLQVEMHSASHGQNLTLKAGSGKSGVNDKYGGKIIVSGGDATGNGQSSIEFHTAFGTFTGGTSTSYPAAKKCSINGIGGLLFGSAAGSGFTNSSIMAGIDISYGGSPAGLAVGAENNLTTRTNSTNKVFRMGFAPYNTSHQLGNVLTASATSTTNIVDFGGGTSVMNGPTDIRFSTATAVGVASATCWMNIGTAGNVSIGNGTTVGGKKLDVNGDMRIRGDLGTLNFYRATSPTDIAYIQYDEAGARLNIAANNKAIRFLNGLSFAETIVFDPEGRFGVAGFNTGLGYMVGFKSNNTARKPLGLQWYTSGQTANMLDVLNDAGTVLASLSKDGAFQPPTLADASAPNNSIYYSSTASKLVYKDSGGTVNNLY